MNNTRTTPIPDGAIVSPELIFDETWDTAAIAGLIRSKSASGETPAFLFLGKKEAGLLRDHLAQAFGVESVTTLKDTYYMGLEVVEIDCERFLFTGGRKTSRTLPDPVSRRSAWRDRESESLWRFRI